MSHILNQRRFLTKRYFEITPSSLKISMSKPFKYYEEEFPFEEIGRKTIKKMDANRYLLIFSVICLIGLFVNINETLIGNKGDWEDTIFYIILTPIILFLFWVGFSNNIHLMLADKRYILFYRNIPNKTKVQKFIDLFLSEQKSYLVNKYTKREPHLSPDRLMDQLMWLKDRGILDESEFENFKKDLFPSIGFTFNASNN